MSARARPLAVLLLAIGLVACSNDARRAPETGALSYAQGLVLSIREDALVPFDGLQAARGPAYATPHVAALSAIGHRAAIALNRLGLAFLDFEPRARRVSIAQAPLPEFHGRSVGSLFSGASVASRDFLVLLYRHPEEAEGQARPGALLAVDADSGQSRIETPPEAIGAATLYSLFPFAGGERLVATREISFDRVHSSHWLWDPELPTAPLALSRAEFEDRLKPLGRAEAPAALLAAVDALTARAPTAPLLVEAHTPDGAVRWFALGAGPAAERAEVIAALDKDGKAAVAVYPSGPVAVCAALDDGDLRAELVDLKPPLPDAVWTAALLIADSGGAQALVLAWREDYFPQAGASGILIAPLFR